jgi:hypothetical protein
MKGEAFMKSYQRINSIANPNSDVFMEEMAEALRRNEKDYFQSEVHYSYANGTFTVLILGYIEK